MTPQIPQRNGFFYTIIWIIIVVIGWYIFIGSFAQLPFMMLSNMMIMAGAGSEWVFTVNMYFSTLSSVIVLAILCAFRKNRYILKSLLPARSKSAIARAEAAAARGYSADQYRNVAAAANDDALAELYGRSRNTLRALMMGLLLGFLTNFFCILCALIHGDIKLYYDFSAGQIPYMFISLLCVLIQSASEEMWCRGFMYERLHEKHPLWLAILVNGVFFGLLHMFNPSVTVLSIVSICVCGISYSILRWYTGNIWIAFGIHTGWNFTQNYLFGLPNSGLISEASVFHLGAANGTSNLIYDFGFGVEGALPAIFADAMVLVVCLILAQRDGRLGELKLKACDIFGKKTAPVEAPAAAVQVTPVEVPAATVQVTPVEVPTATVQPADSPEQTDL